MVAVSKRELARFGLLRAVVLVEPIVSTLIMGSRAFSVLWHGALVRQWRIDLDARLLARRRADGLPSRDGSA